jgi:alpha-N-arabinofuranosidase
VIAPIMTEPGGDSWRQTTFFPFAVTSRLARGTVLEVKLESDTHDTKEYGTVATVDAVATFDAEAGTAAVFLINRSETEQATVTIDVAALGELGLLDASTLADDDVYAANTLADQNRVGLTPNTSATIADGLVTITLPAVSWSAVSLG